MFQSISGRIYFDATQLLCKIPTTLNQNIQSSYRISENIKRNKRIVLKVSQSKIIIAIITAMNKY